MARMHGDIVKRSSRGTLTGPQKVGGHRKRPLSSKITLAKRLPPEYVEEILKMAKNVPAEHRTSLTKASIYIARHMPFPEPVASNQVVTLLSKHGLEAQFLNKGGRGSARKPNKGKAKK
ncbi:MAG: hypothetical protein JW744_00615 [Candidatus Diapherotrites archaeon]|uniref:Uncharacterized protein n=1 Tax=Candidatus Iainarchaeum sp. TaxID=3101447 RepID=A0A938YMK4_9ARCH|nr:hypothetical protein [Candidatus Diapherotrites archaeon]